jgi:hypothetical protein
MRLFISTLLLAAAIAPVSVLSLQYRRMKESGTQKKSQLVGFCGKVDTTRKNRLEGSTSRNHFLRSNGKLARENKLPFLPPSWLHTIQPMHQNPSNKTQTSRTERQNLRHRVLSRVVLVRLGRFTTRTTRNRTSTTGCLLKYLSKINQQKNDTY